MELYTRVKPFAPHTSISHDSRGGDASEAKKDGRSAWSIMWLERA